MDEILALGFDTIEISHGLKVSLLPGIKKAFAAGRMKVSGVHNFCPSPVEVMIDAPDAYEFSSHRQHERERAMALTLKTMEFSAEFAARCVVLHMGKVPMEKISKELTELPGNGMQQTEEYMQRKLKLIKVRESMTGLDCGRAREALATIAAAAEKAGVPMSVITTSGWARLLGCHLHDVK